MRLRWFPSADYTWRDLLVWLMTAREGSEVVQHAIGPERSYWTGDRQLLASVVDALNILIWQPTKDGRKGRNQPHPIPRPGVVDERKEVVKHGKKKDAKSASEVAALLGM